MTQNPFKFLAPFEKEDRDQFFGRDREIDELYQAVHASNLTLLYGRSGIGKTSLVNCGLANRFDDTDWLPIWVRRCDDLNRSLRGEIAKRLSPDADDLIADPGERIRELFAINRRPIYLILDQFEELFIFGSRLEQERFAATLAELLRTGPSCKVLIVIREELLSELAILEKALPSLFDNRLRIEPMNYRNLARVIVGMARFGRIRIDDPATTIPKIIENLRRNRKGVDLIDLQIYWDRLLREATALPRALNADRITFDSALVDRVGKFENVLPDFIDAQLTAIERSLAARGVRRPEGIPFEILFAMLTGDGARRAMDVGEIMRTLPKKNVTLTSTDIRYCLEELVRVRLVRPQTPE